MYLVLDFSNGLVHAHLGKEATLLLFDLTGLLGESEREAAPGGEAIRTGVAFDVVALADGSSVGCLEIKRWAVSKMS